MKAQRMRILALVLIFCLVLPLVVAQRGSPIEDFSEPFKQVLTWILEFFKLEWLDDDAASYAALARISIFLITFVVGYEVLAKFSRGAISTKTAKIISLCFALIAIVFMPEEWLLGMGATTAALIAAIPIFAIIFVCWRLTRSMDTSQTGSRIMFILVLFVLMAIMGFLGVYLGNSSSSRGSVLGISMSLILWLIYIVGWVYLGMALFNHGFSGSMSGLGSVHADSDFDFDKDEHEREDEEKKEADALEDAEKAEEDEVDALKGERLLSELDKEDEKTAIAEERAEALNVKDEEAALADLDNAERIAGAVASGKASPQGAKQAFLGEVGEAEKLAERLVKRLRKQRDIIHTQRRRLTLEKQACQAAGKSRDKARRKLSHFKGRITKLKKSKHIKKNHLQDIGRMEKEAERLLNENRALQKKYRKFLTKEEQEMRDFEDGIKKVTERIEKARDLLKKPSQKNVLEAQKIFRETLPKHRELALKARRELQYARQKEQLDKMEILLDRKAIEIEEQLKQYTLRIVSESEGKL